MDKHFPDIWIFFLKKLNDQKIEELKKKKRRRKKEWLKFTKLWFGSFSNVPIEA